MTKKGFTLAEVLMTLTVLGILIGITMPVLMNSKPDSDKVMFRKTYYTIEKNVSKMINDTAAYPNAANEDPANPGTYLGFADVSDTGQGTLNKFCYYFMNNLNVLGDITCPVAASATIETEHYMGRSTDGADWFLYLNNNTNEGFNSETNFPVKIVVDVNGATNKPNCALITSVSTDICNSFSGVTPNPTYTCANTEAACKSPDLFVISLRRDGKLRIKSQLTDASDNKEYQPKAVEYLKDPFNNKRSD